MVPIALQWTGSAALCRSDDGRLLMVLQGAPGEAPLWAVPSGMREGEETLAACCAREVWEETGYRALVREEVFVKRGTSFGIEVEVHYFAADVVSGDGSRRDPDGLIHQVGWMGAQEIRDLELSFPEDRQLLLGCLSAATQNP